MFHTPHHCTTQSTGERDKEMTHDIVQLEGIRSSVKVRPGEGEIERDLRKLAKLQWTGDNNAGEMN